MPKTSASDPPPTHERRLDNGLTVLVRQDASAPVAAIVTHVKTGYFDEPDTLVGISHVLEHMFFKGTRRRGVGDIARETKALGGYLNAGTIYDYTTYYTVLPSSALEPGLDIQADALRNSTIDAAELEKELGVIVEESKRKLDNPGAVASERLYQTMFDRHRMRRWRIGTEEEIQRLTREDVERFYRAHYRPGNIILVIAGAVDPESTFALVERMYGDMEAGEPPSDGSPEEPPRGGFRFRELSGDLTQSHLEWGWRTPGSLHDDTPALDLLAVVLGRGRASRLYREVREAGLVSGIGSYNYTPTELGVFGVSAQLAPADTRGAVTEIWRSVARVRDREVAAPELERARTIVEAARIRRMETAEGQARYLAHWQALGDWRLGDEYRARLRRVTPEDLRRVAGEYLSLENATAFLYRPEDAESPGWSAAELAEHLAGAQPHASTSEEDDVVRAPRRPTGSSAAASGSRVRGLVSARTDDDVSFHRTPSGVPVVVAPGSAAPLVSMTICARGGKLQESLPEAGATGLMARTAVKGTASHNAEELALRTEALGGSIGFGVSADLFNWSITVPRTHMAEAFALLADVAFRPTFPESELERERKVTLQQLDRLRDDTYRFPARLFMQAAFPDHPYGYRLEALEESLRSHSRDDISSWHAQVVHGGKPTVMVVGAVEFDDVVEAVEEALDGLPEVGDAPAPVDVRRPAWPAASRIEVVERDKSQTALLLGIPGPARGSEDRYALRVLASVLSGLGGRLFEELRGRRSLAYTVSAYPVVRWLGGAFAAYIATSPGREEEARQGILDEFDRLVEEPVTADELERAQEYTLGTRSIRRQTNTARLGDLVDALLLGSGVDDLRRFEDRIRAVTPGRIRDVFARYYDGDRLVQGIMRGAGGGG